MAPVCLGESLPVRPTGRKTPVNTKDVKKEPCLLAGLIMTQEELDEVGEPGIL